jgi:hypothetical protein
MSNVAEIKDSLHKENTRFSYKKKLVENLSTANTTEHFRKLSQLINQELHVFTKDYRLEKSEIRKSKKVRAEIKAALKIEAQSTDQRASQAKQVDTKRLTEERILISHEKSCRDNLAKLRTNLKQQKTLINELERSPSQQSITKIKELLSLQLKILLDLIHHEDICVKIGTSERQLKALKVKIMPELKDIKKRDTSKIILMICIGIILMFVLSNCASFDRSGGLNSNSPTPANLNDKSISGIMKRTGSISSKSGILYYTVKTQIGETNFEIELLEDTNYFVVEGVLNNNYGNVDLLGGRNFMEKGKPHTLIIKWENEVNSGFIVDIHADKDIDIIKYGTQSYIYSDTISKNDKNEQISISLSPITVKPLGEYEREKIEKLLEGKPITLKEFANYAEREAEKVYEQLLPHLKALDNEN